jgi:hypothetical protein
MSNDKAVKENKTLATTSPEMAALAVFAEQDAAQGFENMGAGDFAIPFISIIQKGSPQVDKDNKAAYVEGAEIGMFYDSSNKELYDAIDVIPCHYKRAMVEWKPRENGGGFVASHPVGYEQKFPKNEKGRWITPAPDENEILDTRYFFCLLVKKDGSMKPCILSFTATNIKVAKEWSTRMQEIKLPTSDGKSTFTPAMFAFVWHISTLARANDKFTWRVYNVEDNKPVTAEVYQVAKETRDMFVANENAVKPQVQDGAVEGLD